MVENNYTYPDGTKYKGQWKDHKRHGRGTLTRSDGTKYDGEWENDKPSGVGTLKFPDGRKYQGTWKDGKFHGKGRHTSADGKIYIGEFRFGQYHGIGTMIMADGKVISGRWENGKITDKEVAEPNNIKHEQAVDLNNQQSSSVELEWISNNDYIFKQCASCKKHLDIFTDYAISNGYGFYCEICQDKILPTQQIKPWDRFFARMLDMLFYAISIYIIILVIAIDYAYLLANIILHNPLFNSVLLFIWCFIEAIFIAKYKTTPGKWWFKIYVTNLYGDKLSYGDALNRSIAVWAKGLCLGLSFLATITLILSYRHLTKYGVTSWDLKGKYLCIKEE